MSSTFLARRHFKTFFLRTSIVLVTEAGIKIAGLTRLRSYNSITPHHEEWFQGNDLQELDGAGEVGHNGKLDRSVAVIVIVAAVGTPHGVPMLADFVGLQWSEARLIKKYKNILCKIPLLWSDERKYKVWLQQFMYGKIHGTYIYIYI